MKCSTCGAEIADDAKFCSSCGAPVTSAEPEPSQPAPPEPEPAPPQPTCPQCGSALSPGQEFCGNCGYRLTPTRVEAASAPDTSLARRLTSVIMVTVAAVLILIAIALPWYAYRSFGFTSNISFGDMLDTGFPSGDWFGITLPPIVLIAIAAVALITAIVSFLTRKNMNALWSALGSLAMVAILANAGYLIWWFYNYSGEVVNIVHAGSVLVLVAAIVLIVGASIRPRRL